MEKSNMEKALELACAELGSTELCPSRCSLPDCGQYEYCVICWKEHLLEEVMEEEGND